MFIAVIEDKTHPQNFKINKKNTIYPHINVINNIFINILPT